MKTILSEPEAKLIETQVIRKFALDIGLIILKK